jgi:hypothetical protein
MGGYKTGGWRLGPGDWGLEQFKPHATNHEPQTTNH